ncbi:Glycosyltransferase family 28 C-terminal domain-containing protein [Faunimonas pinastri]|uniref:Glycosyltransferase family 28 C-terminal domain-containing protein n=1 Tax=Faunimonas pinastri TaxID=1855383 RepID=A0A1H9L8Q8_9HYPH|nr:glycosyltransferase [Faunimonas pinastri]SER07567.1 Glycosyltransferase family 28 C-terminal domain-containing protein [Faunimonas pinastri]
MTVLNGRKDGPAKVIMLPSAGGGIGHIARTAALARALVKRQPDIAIEFVLDAERLRPFNIDATMDMGFRPRLLPPRNSENRAGFVRACLGDADLVVDDVARYLLPLRHHIPNAAWVSILMHPIGDELFLDWPFIAQMDALIWPYAPAIGFPQELSGFEAKLVHTGPFLETSEVPEKAAARESLGFGADEKLVVYAPRGFPFGREFGHRLLSSLYRSVEKLRTEADEAIRLVLIAVNDREDLRGVSHLPARLPDWVTVKGVVPAADSLLYERAADILVAEGTSTMHEGAALGTPLLVVPGPIKETQKVAASLSEAKAARVMAIGEVTAESVQAVMAAMLSGDQRAYTDKARSLVMGGGGVAAAADLVLDILSRPRVAWTPSIYSGRQQATGGRP